MTNVKVSLSVVLPGSTMFTPEVCESDPKLCEVNTMVLKSVKPGKKPVVTKEVLKYYTRKCVPAKQSINLSEEAYRYMVANDCPEWSKPSEWKRLKPEQRLVLHLNRIAASLNGKVGSYEVFAD